MKKHRLWTAEETAYLHDLMKQFPEHTYQQYANMLTNRFGLEFTSEAVRNHLKRTKKKETKENIEPFPVKYKETLEILPDGSHKSDKLLRMTAEQAKDVDYLLKAHGFDKEKWELVSARNNIWNVYSKQDGIQTLYSSKITVKPKQKGISQEDIKEMVQDLLKNYSIPIYKPIRHSDSGKLLEINVSDLHLNKLGYKEGEYDHEQAEEIFFYILNDVITRTKDVKLEKILFIWSNDFFNIDNLAKATTNGTPQDTTISYADMFKQGKRMLIQAIDLLRQFAPVETVQVGANHDRLTSYAMAEVLDAWFKSDDNVIIDNDPLSRKYRRFGRCLIGFSHGDKEKKTIGKDHANRGAKGLGRNPIRGNPCRAFA